MEGGPVLGYVPVMYPHHDGPPLPFRANDVTALNVAWQFFVNGLDYSFSVWMEDHALANRLEPNSMSL